MADETVDPGYQAGIPRRGETDPYAQQGVGKRRAVRNPAPPSQDTPPLPPLTGDTPTTPIAPRPVVTVIQARIDTFIPLSDTPLDVVYGPFWKGGQVYHEHTYNDGVTVIAWAVCWGPINSITDIQIDGQPIGSFPGVAYNIHLTNDTNDSILNAYVPGIGKPADTVAHVVASFPANTTIPNPHSAMFGGTGLLTFDPETDPTLTTKYYKPYPPNCLADYLSSTKYGEGQPLTQVYGPTPVPNTHSLVVANQDSYFDIGGGTPRYLCSIILNSRRNPQDNKTLIRTCGALNYNYNNGLFNYWVDKPQSLSGITVTDVGDHCNVVRGFNTTLIVNGKADCPSQVMVHFVNAAASHKDDFAVFPATSALPVGAELIRKEYYLGQITYDQAFRIAKYLYKRLNMDKSAHIRVMPDGGEQILPGILISVTSQKLNWSNQTAIVTDWTAAPDEQNQFIWEGRLELYDAAVYDDTKGTATAYAPPANPSPWDVIGAPVNVTLTSDANGDWALYWDQAAVVSQNLYGSSFWAATNLGNYVGSRVNDGNTSLKAFDVNVAGESIVTIDFGSGNAKNISSYAIWLSGGGNPFNSVEVSDNGSTWAVVSHIRPIYPTAGDQNPGWDDAGAHRFFRIRQVSTAAIATDILEIQLFERGAPNQLITHYQVVNVATPDVIYQTLAAGATPTRTKPLTIRPITITTTNHSGGGTRSFSVKIYAMINERASAAVSASILQLIVAGLSEEIALSNTSGANHDLDISGLSINTGGHSEGAISSAIGNFSIGGFTPAFSGRSLTVYNNTAFTMTIVDNDGLSTVGQRFKTFTGAPVNITGGGFARFECSVTAGFWLLIVHVP